MITVESLETKLAALKQARESLAQQAIAHDGAIQLLTQLINEEKTQEPSEG